MLRQLWFDESGFILSAEFIIIATILVIGLVAGLSSVRDAVILELADVGQGISNANQSFAFGGSTSASSSAAGSGFADALDFCDTADTANGGFTNSRGLAVATEPVGGEL
jgi:hypothetical protein